MPNFVVTPTCIHVLFLLRTSAVIKMEGGDERDLLALERPAGKAGEDDKEEEDEEEEGAVAEKDAEREEGEEVTRTEVKSKDDDETEGVWLCLVAI